MSTPLLLLHGAMSASNQFDGLLPHLTNFEVHRLNFEGHGDTPSGGRPFRAEHFVDNVLTYLDGAGLASVNVFGYSLGGFVASMVAHDYPERIGRIVTLGTKFVWDEATAQGAAKMMDVGTIKAKVPKFADALGQTHTALGWEAVVEQSAAMGFALAETGGLTADYMAELSTPVRVMIGDRDQTANLVESYNIYRSLAHGEFAVLPNTPHPLQKVDPALLVQLIEGFVLGEFRLD